MTIANAFRLLLLLAMSLAVSTQAMAQSMAPHPRLILDGPTLATLHARMAANTPQWQQLKSYCDSFIGGTVQLPDGNAYPDPPNIGQGYQGSSYWSAALAEGLCYQTLLASNPSATSFDALRVASVRALGAPAFQLAQAFNLFYHHHHILTETDRLKKLFLLQLSRLAEVQLVAALELLGIEAPEKM